MYSNVGICIAAPYLRRSRNSLIPERRLIYFIGLMGLFEGYHYSRAKPNEKVRRTPAKSQPAPFIMNPLSVHKYCQRESRGF